MIRRYRFLMARRFMQIAVLVLFFAGKSYGWNVLKGDLSYARMFDAVPLSDPFAILQVFAAGTIVSFDALIGALIVTLFYGVIGGRAFCGWVCPANIVTDAANWLRRVLRIDAVGKIWWISRKTRYWVVGLSIAISAFLSVAAFEWISPISMLHRGVIYGMGFGWLAVLIIFLFDIFVIKNGFCGCICPLGGFYSSIGRFSLFRIRHYKGNCTLCMKCVDICPERQVLHMVGKQNDLVLSGECTNCGRCIEVCEDNAMKFGSRLTAGIKSKSLKNGGDI